MLPRRVAFALLLASAPACPQSSDVGQMRHDLDALRAEVTTLRADVEKLKSAATPASPLIEIGDHPTVGSAAAKVILIEFSDYQCPFCLEYFKTTYPKIVSGYVKTGKIRYTTRDFPSETNHPDSVKAAIAAGCAGEQNKFWEMHDQLFTNQRTLGTDGIALSARAAGLNTELFETCRTSGRFGAAIQKDLTDSTRIAVRGTPTFYFAVVDSADPSKMRLMRGFTGAQPFANFQQAIDGLIAAAAK